ncbi:actin-1-like [Osmerus mordax]|uniref:actin-1-like n=1 Tax=Osmerus mordax TaxID=8014 RepID=UPI0035100250
MVGSEDFMENVAIVIDPGSGYTRAGFSGTERPKAVTKSLVQMKMMDQCYFGLQIPSKGSDNLSLKSPVTNGIITDWDSTEKLWSHIIYEKLQVCPKEHGILVTDPAFSPISNREKIAELLFEKFSAPAMYVNYQPVLSMYSSGLVTGLIVDSGASRTSVSPVCNGYCLPHATFHMDLAGQAISDYLSKLIKDLGCGYISCVEEMKKSCYISQNYETELRGELRRQPLDYRLPDGTTFSLGDERFLCPEILFCPSIAGVSKPGVHVMAMNSLQKCNPEWRDALMTNVVLCGGSSLFSGLTERLQMEMEKLAPRDSGVRVMSGPHQECSSWVGGSIITCLSSFQPMWVKRQEYEEEGSAVVRKRCF